MSQFADYPAEMIPPWQAVTTEDGKLTREILNMGMEIRNPLDEWPIDKSGWNMAGLKRYAAQLLSPENNGFDYTYGARLRAYNDADAGEVDQIAYVIDNLKHNTNTRRAIAITWSPWWDNDSDHVPCLQLLDFLIRDNRLQCTAVFRSHDIARAWVPNVYGIGQLMKYIGDEVGVPVGSLTTISCSAHIYIE
jgi:thymidylate synthase